MILVRENGTNRIFSVLSEICAGIGLIQIVKEASGGMPTAARAFFSERA